MTPDGAIESDFSRRKMRTAAICLIGSIFASGMLPFNATGLVILPMTSEFGWTRTEFSFATAAQMWCGALVVTLWGRLADRFGARPVILYGTLIIGVATAMIGLQTNHLWQLYAVFGLLGAGAYSGVAYQKILASLFTKHRGKALAVFGMESAVATAIIPLIASGLIAAYGWRGMYFAFGGLILILAPIIYFSLEEPGANRALEKGGSRRPAQMTGMATREVVRDTRFWMIVFASTVSAGTAGGILTHMVAAAGDRGFSLAQGAAMLTSYMLAGTIGTFVSGILLDRINNARVAIPFLTATALGAGLLSVVDHDHGFSMLLTAAAIMGFGAGTTRPTMTYLLSRYFGLKSFTEISGIQQGVTAVAFGLLPPAFGAIYDFTGTYGLAWAIVIAGHACAALVFAFLGPYRFSTAIQFEEPSPIDAASKAE